MDQQVWRNRFRLAHLLEEERNAIGSKMVANGTGRIRMHVLATVGIDVVLTGDDPSALAKRHEVGRQQQLTQQCFQSGLLAGASASWSYDRHVHENYTEGNSRICRSSGTYAPECMARMKNGIPAARD